jgi:hypothetical protein
MQSQHSGRLRQEDHEFMASLDFTVDQKVKKKWKRVKRKINE